MGRVLLVGLAVLAGMATTAKESRQKALYEQHRWFDLREAVESSRDVPSLYLGAVASAFNDTKAAEKYWNQTIESAANSEDLAEAHEMLGKLYARSGRHRDALRQLDAILKLDPGNTEVQNIRALYAAFSEHPDQSIGEYRFSVVHAEVRKDRIVLPISVRGRTVHWILDTDFNLCAMSESEARRLGVSVDDVSALAGDSASGTVKARTAVVDELAIGGVRLRNVAFLVLPDAAPPMDGLAPGYQGLVGLPVALALRAIGWKSDGTFEIGFAAGKDAHSKRNLCLDDFSPVTRVQLGSRNLDFVLDTGNQAGTQLWERFAKDFGTLVQQNGRKGKQTITAIGGSREMETIVLPEIEMEVGGLKTMLRPATIFSKPVGDDFHEGLLGMDILGQAQQVRIDFRSMVLQLTQ